MTELGVHRSALLTDLALCINRYRLFSPGWYVCVLARVQLSPDEWEVPGLTAMVNYGSKKQCEVRDEVFHGAPNFIMDVFDSPEDAEYVRRKERFSRHGVHEYLVAFDDQPVILHWYRRSEYGFQPIKPDSDGVFRSHALPNLWMPHQALQDRDWWAILGCIERGVSRRADFS